MGLLELLNFFNSVALLATLPNMAISRKQICKFFFACNYVLLNKIEIWCYRKIIHINQPYYINFDSY